MLKRFLSRTLLALLFGGALYGAYQLGSRSESSRSTGSAASEVKDEHEGHAHGQEENPNQLPLSDQARKNLNLKLGEVSLSDYWRTVVVPGEVGEKPGHSESRITATINGIILQVHVLPGQTVKPGDPLFDVQATGDVLANAQSTLLKTLQEIELVDAELKRLKPITEQGAVPGVRLLEKQYEKQRLESLRQVQVQELLVRGLTVDQIDEIVETKILLRQFTVYVPGGKAVAPVKATNRNRKPSIVPISLQKEAEGIGAASRDLVYSVEKIDIFPGKQVQSGDELCDLALHTNLQIIGMAFQSESDLISSAMEEQRSITAIFDTSDTQAIERKDLQIQYVDNVVDPNSRLFRFYIPIQNEIVRDLDGPEGVKFRAWRFKPGQRVQLMVPVEHWESEIVLPTEAVVKEGADAYVFRSNGNLMERVPVSIKHEDPRTSVLANDGNLFEGDIVALNEAYQMNLALRKQQGSGVDPHAGHNH
ncbi:MAG: efflux RND transporter periplasmic adaptor subunit [Planctomycetaceae bacterium]|nr:efflux RND transporter periplasmic adaptor subunit [Planctomycetaceae bacterium]